ncbi:MAG TPA: ABC transporter permease, partial [Vicinamibacterales bacterium]|nr:ABC transporter permease [Vicinamibacterales bacterium]
AAFGNALLQRLESLPSVKAAAVSTAPPIGEATAAVVSTSIHTATGPDYKPALVHAVTAGYAGTLGMNLRSGRFIDRTDSVQAMPVAVVNETLARTLFPDGRAIGRSFSRLGSPKPLTVIGIVADTRQAGPLRPAMPAFYIPFDQNDQPVRLLSIALSTAVAGGRLGPGIRRALAELDAEVPPFALKTGTELVDGTIAIQRFNMLVLGAFAVFALILALSGLYAVLAQAVQHARRDFGIRQALGATSGRIIRSVLSRAMAPAVVGVFAGGAAALGAAELIASQLFGVAPNDPLTFVSAALTVLLISILVVTQPAMKAARVDVSTLLRHE